MSKVKLHITGLSYSHSQTEAYALILSEENNPNRRLPIIIGKAEAQVIAIYLEGLESPRPLTHDLLKTIVETLRGDVVEVNIVKLISGVFYAEICLVKDTQTFRIDARVSDAVALALRFDSPIYCEESVMEVASFMLEENEAAEENEGNETPSATSSSFSDYTEKQLEMMMNEAVRDENYERAARLKKELENRKQSNN